MSPFRPPQVTALLLVVTDGQDNLSHGNKRGRELVSDDVQVVYDRSSGDGPLAKRNKNAIDRGVSVFFGAANQEDATTLSKNLGVPDNYTLEFVVENAESAGEVELFVVENRSSAVVGGEIF